jgi:hypothetical protein
VNPILSHTHAPLMTWERPPPARVPFISCKYFEGREVGGTAMKKLRIVRLDYRVWHFGKENGY